MIFSMKVADLKQRLGACSEGYAQRTAAMEVKLIKAVGENMSLKKRCLRSSLPPSLTATPCLPNLHLNPRPRCLADPRNGLSSPGRAPARPSSILSDDIRRIPSAVNQ